MAFEPNDTLDTAVLAYLDTFYPFYDYGSIADNDVDMYSFYLEAGDSVTIDIDAEYYGSPLDSFIRLFDSTGLEIASNDNLDGLDSFIEFTADVSDYYSVGVSGVGNSAYDPLVASSGSTGASTGEFDIYIELPVEPNDTLDTAVLAYLDTFYPFYDYGSIADNDVDMYSFYLEAGDSVTIDIDAEYYGSPLDSFIRLFDSTGLEIASNDNLDGLDSFIEFTADVSDYYSVGVSGVGNSAYDPLVAGSGSTGASTGEFDIYIELPYIELPVEPNDTLDTAVLAYLDTFYPFYDYGSIADNDVDMYSFYLEAGDSVTIDIDAEYYGSPLDSFIRLFDSTGLEIASNDNLDGLDSFIEFTADVSDYYSVGVSGVGNSAYDPLVAGSGSTGASTGEFDIYIALPYIELPVEPNDTLDTAVLAYLDTFYSFYDYGSIADNDVDMYSFYLEAGDSVTIDINGEYYGSPLDSFIRLFDSTGLEVASNDNLDGLNSFIEFTADVSDYYSVGVSGVGNSAYDPLVAGSGSTGASTGEFDISIELEEFIDPFDPTLLPNGDILFTGLGSVPGTLDSGNIGFGALSQGRNDDSSSNVLTLPFNINFFGNEFSTFFINNNGTITFDSALSTYTPDSFPVANQPLIATYWGDVDTRGGGEVYVGAGLLTIDGSERQVVAATWHNVGFYSANTSLINTFQAALVDRGDVEPGAFDIIFNYADLNWTTGDASGGVNGLGGTEAQAGFDAGDLTNFLALGGSQTPAVLDLINQTNLSDPDPITPENENAGRFVFTIRNGNVPGTSRFNPLQPVISNLNNELITFEFDFNVGDIDVPIFIDPVVAIGYNYIVNSGPNISSVQLPVGIGDNTYDLFLFDSNLNEFVDSGTDIAGGDLFAFAESGVDRFSIRGIEVDARLDPSDATAFVTGLTFTDTGIVNMNQIPLSVDVPSILLTLDSISAQEDGTNELVYTFTRIGDTENALTVNYTVGGTATFNTDYTQTGADSFSTTGTVTFDAGSSTATLTIDPTLDTELETDETVSLTLVSSTDYLVETLDAVTGLIVDSTIVNPQDWNLDIDGDGSVRALSDGIMAVRYMFGAAFPGDALIDGAIAPGATRDLAQIQDYLQQGVEQNFLDIDGDGSVRALSDGIMAVRYMFGAAFPGDALIDGAIAPGATRDLTQIQDYLAGLATIV